MKSVDDYVNEAQKDARDFHAQMRKFQQEIAEEPNRKPDATEFGLVERALRDIIKRSSWEMRIAVGARGPTTGRFADLLVMYLVELRSSLLRRPKLRSLLDQKEQVLRDLLKANRNRLAALEHWHRGDPKIAIVKGWSGQINCELAALRRARVQLKHKTWDEVAAAATFYRACFRGRVPSYKPLKIVLGDRVSHVGRPEFTFQSLLSLASCELKRGRSWPRTTEARHIVAIHPDESVLKPS